MKWNLASVAQIAFSGGGWTRR